MSDDKILLEIDLSDDFDMANLELAINDINECDGQLRAKKILIQIYNKWAEKIGHPEWKKPDPKPDIAWMLQETLPTLRHRNSRNMPSRKQHAYCTCGCGYSTESMEYDALVCKISNEGGYIMSDKEGGCITKCPECGSSGMEVHID